MYLIFLFSISVWFACQNLNLKRSVGPGTKSISGLKLLQLMPVFLECRIIIC